MLSLNQKFNPAKKEELGRGGFGIVYKVEDTLSQSWALKVIKLDEGYNIEKAKREVDNVRKICKNSSHDPRRRYIIQIVDAWEFSDPEDPQIGDWIYKPWLHDPIDGFYVIQMEFCDQRSLNCWLKNKKTNGNLDEGRKFFSQITKGLEFLHEQNCIHRDLHPANILLTKVTTQEGQVVVAKIGDFGSSRIRVPNSASILTYTVGADLYGSPEQFNRRKNPGGFYEDYTTKSDIFSLGIIFFCIHCPPQKSFGEEALQYHQHLEGFREEDTKIPKDFSEIFPKETELLRQMLDNDPNGRPTARQISLTFSSLHNSDLGSSRDSPGSSDGGPSGAVELNEAVSMTRLVLFKTGDHNTVINYGIHAPPIKFPPPSNILFNVQIPIGSFFERKGFFPKLHESLHAQEAESAVLTRITIIFGLGGIGKTQMARKYIQKYKTQYDHVVWVNAETQNSMTTTFSKLAQYLNVPITHGDKDRDVDDIIKDCYDIICLKKSLIVFDNAEHYEDKKFKNQSGIKSFLPSALSSNLVPPFVLVTTRNRDWASPSCHVVPMELFNDAECIEFIVGQLPSEKNCEEDASKLGRILGGLILALQQAIAFIREEDENRRWSSVGVKGYIEAFGEKRNDLLSYSPSDSDYGATVATTWRMTLDKIQKSEEGGELVKEICEVMAFLSSDGVPIKLVQNIFTNWDNIQIGNGMRQLNRYALIEMSRDSNFVSMHRLVQHVILESVRGAGRVDAILDNLVKSCGDLVDNLGYNFEDCGDLFSNFLSIVDKFGLAPPKREFLLFQHRLGLRYSDMGKYREAMYMFEHVLENQKQILGPEHPDLLETQQYIADVLRLQKKYEKALQLFEHVFSIRKKILSSDHRDLLATKNNMAFVLDQLGRSKEALEMYEEILQVSKIRLGSEHPSVLTVQHNIACFLQMQGKYKEAIKFFENVLAMQERVLGPEHPSVLDTQFGIASTHGHEGKFVKAMEMYEQILVTRKKILSPDHPDVLWTQIQIADIHRYEGRFKEAMEMFQKLLQLWETILEPDNSSLLRVQYGMALVLEKQERYVEAMEILEHVGDLLIKTCGPDHPDLLRTQVAMAMVLVGQKRFEEAIQIYEKVLEIQRQRLGPDSLNTRHNLAFALYEHGRQEEAIEILTNVVKIWEKTENPEHAEAVKAQTRLTDWLSKFDARRRNT